MRVVFFCSDENHFRAIMKATDDRGCDIVLEMLANENLAKDLEVLALGARVMVSQRRGYIVSIAFCSIYGFW